MRLTNDMRLIVKALNQILQYTISFSVIEIACMHACYFMIPMLIVACAIAKFAP